MSFISKHIGSTAMTRLLYGAGLSTYLWSYYYNALQSPLIQRGRRRRHELQRKGLDWLFGKRGNSGGGSGSPAPKGFK